jgi:ABC-type phosphate/phosphonate transport system substrate-binding protein
VGAKAAALLRLLSYLAPSLPHEFFRSIAERIAESLRIPVVLAFETATSGPVEGEADPLTRGEVDVAFLCAPTYLWLAREGRVQLLAAPISSDPRAEGRPVYFSDVVVREGVEQLDLSTARWALNDPASLSGFRCVVDAIGGMPAKVVISGSHLASLDLIRRGEADAAAIDSNVLRMQPRDGLRVISAFGPHPIQPVVARKDLDPVLAERIRDALLAMKSLAEFGFVGFVAVEHAHYARSGRVRHRMVDDSTHAGLRAASG